MDRPVESQGGHLTKRCSRCHRDLPTTAFYSNRSRRDGLGSYCRECSLAWQRANPESRKRTKTKWNQAHPGERYADYRKWRERYPERYKRGQWKQHLRKFGITLRQWDAMLVDQLGLCACCDAQMLKPCVDHDHSCCAGVRNTCGTSACAACSAQPAISCSAIPRIARSALRRASRISSGTRSRNDRR